MKKLFKTFIAVALIGSAASISSCTKTCDAGYEGDKCDTEVRAKFKGSFHVTESKNNGTAYSYSTVISSSSTDILKVAISNLAQGFFNSSVIATVDGTTITITSQEPDSDGYSVQGSGTVANTVITLSYTITGLDSNGNTVTDSYSATLTPQ